MEWFIIWLIKGSISIIKMRPDEGLYIVTNDRLGKHFWSLCSDPMDILLAIHLKWSPKVWYGLCITWLLLKVNTGWFGFLILREKITSWVFFLEASGLKLIFHWHAELLTFSRPLFKALADKFVFWTTKNREVSSAKSLGFDDNSCEESFM